MEPLHELLIGHRFGEMKALHDVAAGFPEEIQLGLVFHALGHDFQFQAACQFDRVLDDDPSFRIGLHAVNERVVSLQLAEGHPA